MPFNFGQIELMNAKDYLHRSAETFKSLNGNWVVNIVSIEERCSYLFCNSKELKELLTQITAAKAMTAIDTYSNNLLVTDRVWLRKEYLKEILLLPK